MAFGGSDPYPVNSGPSFSIIDGVEIKINDQFRPPTKVTMPMNYQAGNPADVLFMDYDFGLEEGVLDWTQRKRHEQAAVELAKQQEAAEKLEQFTQSQSEEPEPTVPPDDLEPPAQSVQHEAGASADPKLEPLEATARVSHAPAGGGVPFFHGLSSGGMLMPTPIASANADKKPESQTQKASFNIADFEREQDPFDNLELKVLNDMEELNKVLQASNISSAPSNPPVTSQAAGTSEVQPAPMPQLSVATSVSVSQSYVPMSTQAQAQPSGFSNNMTSIKHVEYPDIDSMSNSNINSNGLYSRPETGSTAGASSSAGQVQFTKFGAHFSKGQTQPADYGSHPQAQAMPQTASNHIQAPPASVGYANHSHKGVNDMAKAFQDFLSQRQTHNQSPNGVVNNFSNTDESQHSRAWSPPPTMNRLRSARSVPDLAAMDDMKSTTQAMAAANTPDLMRSRTQTPPPRPSSEQGWNPYKPLPPTSNGVSHHGGQPESKPGVRPAIPPKETLPNNYSSLSPEAKRFAENITDMGFPRTRVARAVEKLGLNDKKVLDHLCAVNRMGEKGFSPEDSETSLHLFEQKEEKAARYLQLVKQFRELGFNESKIRNALLSCDLDENKALDTLFASS